MKDIRVTPTEDFLRAVTRRHFFRQAGFGIGAAALSSLLNRYAFASGLSAAPALNAVNPLAPKPPHFAPKAKSVIYLFMAGGPRRLTYSITSPSSRS